MYSALVPTARDDFRADGGEIVDPAGAGSQEPEADYQCRNSSSYSEDIRRGDDIDDSGQFFEHEFEAGSPKARLEEIAKQAKILRDDLDRLEGDVPDLAGIHLAAYRIAERHELELDLGRINRGRL